MLAQINHDLHWLINKEPQFYILLGFKYEIVSIITEPLRIVQGKLHASYAITSRGTCVCLSYYRSLAFRIHHEHFTLKV